MGGLEFCRLRWAAEIGSKPHKVSMSFSFPMSLTLLALMAVQGMFSEQKAIGQEKKRKPATQFKPPNVSRLLILHWPKQILWLNPKSGGQQNTPPDMRGHDMS